MKTFKLIEQFLEEGPDDECREYLRLLLDLYFNSIYSSDENLSSYLETVLQLEEETIKNKYEVEEYTIKTTVTNSKTGTTRVSEQKVKEWIWLG